MSFETRPLSTPVYVVARPGSNLERTLLRAMEEDDVVVARLTRAFVRCSMTPNTRDFRDLRQDLAVIATSRAPAGMDHPTLQSAMAEEADDNLRLVRLATLGLVLSQPESWFNTSEAHELLSSLINRTYIW